jgi:hypothetical protein
MDHRSQAALCLHTQVKWLEVEGLAMMAGSMGGSLGHLVTTGARTTREDP